MKNVYNRKCSKYKNAIYNIKFSNPFGTQTGISKIIVNGTMIEGNLLPYYEDRTFDVQVIMG